MNAEEKPGAGVTRPPGLVRPAFEPDVVTMFCTAGHVDHGKTQLVRALTGCATDRLREEIERGLTIELGFAPCWLGDGLCAGIVDVPGHERFVRTMVAGVSGMDACVLVIAADDGVMPQTREHVEIMELMGMTRGLVALTKIDLVPPGAVEERICEIREFLSATFLREAPVCPVSSETGEGFAGFYETLIRTLKSALGRRQEGVFRMPVERAFLRQGFGAVVSGIPLEGRIAQGDAVCCLPGGHIGRVRGLERFGRTATSGGAGQCLALNVPEFAKNVPVRGQVLCVPGAWEPGRLFHVRLEGAPRLDPPLRHAAEVSFHTGTAEVQGRLYLLDGREIAAGGQALATVRTNAPVAAAAGDRFLLRRPSPPSTVGGGRVLNVEAEPRRPRRKVLLAALREQEAFLGEADGQSPQGRARRVAFALLREPRAALSAAELSGRLLLAEADVQTALAGLAGEGAVRALEGGLFAHAERAAGLAARMQETLLEQAERTHRLCVPLGEWRRAFDVPEPLWAYGLAEVQREGPIRVVEGFALPAGTPDALPDPERELARRLLARVEREGFETTHPAELQAAEGAFAEKAGRVIEYLCARGDLVRIAPNVLLAAARLREAQRLALETLQADGYLDSPSFRARLGVSRKYAMAILDFFDARRITIRAGNRRRLLPGWERRLMAEPVGESGARDQSSTRCAGSAQGSPISENNAPRSQPVRMASSSPST